MGPHSHKGPVETQNLRILSLKGEIKYKIYFYLPFGRADKFNSVLKEKRKYWAELTNYSLRFFVLKAVFAPAAAWLAFVCHGQEGS